ncbi:MAG: tetratricopeptide repeat protein [Acidobacteriaceae bacterium]|jgi:tetratricopeptide (TPR) repeat protein|nr:tetratricopeptide repeat protein [Acidobacteriaceae bacterium]
MTARRMRLGGLATIAACLMTSQAIAGQTSAPGVTFSDIAPIVHARCAACHHTGGDGPFSLVTYDEVRQHARQIAAAVESGYMPPWKPSPDSLTFTGERRLTPPERAQIEAWVNGGTLPGATPVPTPTFTDGWLHGPPDLVVTLPAYTLRPDGADVFRNFVVHVPGTRARWVRAFEFRPGNRAVHHANLRIDVTNQSRLLDEADPEPGYEGLILNSAHFPDGQFLGWTPGQAAAPGSRDMAWELPANSDLVVQLHLQATGKPEVIQPVIGFYFTDEPPRVTPVMLRLGREQLTIPAGDANYQTTDTFTLPVDAQLLAIQPHAHFRASTVTAIATRTDGSTRTLIHIPDWDFRWQDAYVIAQPFDLPAGTRLTITYTFDNSERNPRNPDRPPQQVEWGWRSSDEMGDVWFQLKTAPADRPRLADAAQHKMAVEQAIGSEVLVARNPDYVSLRNDAAVNYLDLGQPENALRHFDAVTRLAPDSASAWYNDGIALDALGRRADAAAAYRRAIALNPAYSQAHNNLGNALAAEGRLTEAIASYRTALRVDAANPEAHCNLAQALLFTNQPGDAAAEFERALLLRPDWTSCATAYVWLLSAHSRATVRQPARAIALAEHLRTLTNGRDALVLDALAAAYASAGRFDEAIRAANDALSAAEASGSGSPQAIRERLQLYQRHQPFLVPD